MHFKFFFSHEIQFLVRFFHVKRLFGGLFIFVLKGNFTSIFCFYFTYKISFLMNFSYFPVILKKFHMKWVFWFLIFVCFKIKLTSLVMTYTSFTFMCFKWNIVVLFLTKTFLINWRGFWKAIINQILGISSGVSFSFYIYH